MGEERLVNELNNDLSDFGVVEGGKQFLEHPVMKAVLAARRKRINSLLKAGFTTEVNDAPSAFDTPTLKTIKVTKKNVLSILAQEAQAMEQVLIYPAFQLTNETDDFQITLYQFDGFSVSFSNKSRQEYWTNRICEVVDAACEYYGIKSFLIAEENPSIQTSASQQACVTEIVENAETQPRVLDEDIEHKKRATSNQLVGTNELDSTDKENVSVDSSFVNLILVSSVEDAKKLTKEELEDQIEYARKNNERETLLVLVSEQIFRSL